ncbi:hypothetical protein E4631_15520 [Hymenobacter sp. UV11]|nr:hypothetical protein E4631_15520 [Hymenobacter sp. UV11]
MSMGLTRHQAAAAPKVFQLKHRLGEATVIKLLVVVLKCFCDSVRVPDKLSAAELIETAEVLAATYTHDSIKDIMLALKEARVGGYKFYQSVDAGKVFDIVSSYFEKKVDWLNSQHLDTKARSTSAEHSAVAQLVAAGAAVGGIGQRLDPTHPNHDSLRRKLTITNGKARRGLITPEQAEQQRQQVQQANQRKARTDWQPHAAAQRRIESRNTTEDRRLLAKYSQPNQ